MRCGCGRVSGQAGLLHKHNSCKHGGLWQRGRAGGGEVVQRGRVRRGRPSDVCGLRCSLLSGRRRGQEPRTNRGWRAPSSRETASQTGGQTGVRSQGQPSSQTRPGRPLDDTGRSSGPRALLLAAGCPAARTASLLHGCTAALHTTAGCGSALDLDLQGLQVPEPCEHRAPLPHARRRQRRRATPGRPQPTARRPQGPCSQPAPQLALQRHPRLQRVTLAITSAPSPLHPSPHLPPHLPPLHPLPRLTPVHEHDPNAAVARAKTARTILLPLHQLPPPHRPSAHNSHTGPSSSDRT